MTAVNAIVRGICQDTAAQLFRCPSNAVSELMEMMNNDVPAALF